MEEDASRAELSSVSGSAHTSPQPDGEGLLTPSFSPSSVPSSPNPSGTLARFGLKTPTSPTATAAPGSPVDRGQVSAITVVALLDKLVNMLEAVQDNQQRMEQRQADLEGAVRGVQGDVTRLSKTHISTSNSVSKLLERSRKVSANLKDVRERLDKQAFHVKKLEANHGHLLKRNHFKVIISQDDNEIPSSVFVKDSDKTPQPSQYDADSILPSQSVTGSIAGSRAHDEGLQTISLSSDDDDVLAVHHEEYEMCESNDAMGPGTSHSFERRADKFKRNSLKKVDSLKKAFSRQSIGKKVNQITTKIVPPEKRDKIRKSFTPNLPKSPTAKSSSFKVSPMTFNVKKVRDGEAPTQDQGLHWEDAHVEIPALENFDGEIPLAEAHTQDGVVEAVQEMVSPSTPDSMKAELDINGEAPEVECEMNGERSAGLAVPELDGDVGDEEQDEVEEKENHRSPVVETAADPKIPTAAITVEQVS
ncbi:cavin2 [Pungitius sinensis]